MAMDFLFFICKLVIHINRIYKIIIFSVRPAHLIGGHENGVKRICAHLVDTTVETFLSDNVIVVTCVFS